MLPMMVLVRQILSLTWLLMCSWELLTELMACPPTLSSLSITQHKLVAFRLMSHCIAFDGMFAFSLSGRLVAERIQWIITVLPFVAEQ
jgi:hypothetical protein